MLPRLVVLISRVAAPLWFLIPKTSSRSAGRAIHLSLLWTRGTAPVVVVNNSK